jgi:adenylate cyclase class IV
MIEVEKKFILTPGQEKSLIKGAEFLGEKKFTDTYSDDVNYVLTGQDLWLRSRDGKWELKVPMNKKLKERVSDQYKELETEQEILEYFACDKKDSFKDFLAKYNFRPFCNITTARKKYKKEGFGIDLDAMDYGYTLAEIELMVKTKIAMAKATKDIIAFAKKHKIKTDEVVRGKVVEYLRLNNPEHFEKLIVLWVIK